MTERAAAAGVRFLGHRDDMVRLYRGMDVLVLASHREEFPRADGGSRNGIAVIATDIRGCRQAVEDGVTGLLVPPAIPARSLTPLPHWRAIASCEARMGAAARSKAERDFDQQRCIDLTVSTYARLLERSGLERARKNRVNITAGRLSTMRPPSPRFTGNGSLMDSS
jgi:glycosyltransferase involved in cell wall biosynthesis